MTIVNYVKHDLGWFSFFPRVVRLCTFKVGVLPESTWYERFFLNLRLFGTLPNFSLERAKETIQALRILGEQIKVDTADSRVDGVHLRASSIKAKIEEMGGSWDRVGDQLVIQGPSRPSDEWQSYFQVLSKIFGRVEMREGKEVIITSDHAPLIPFGENNRKTECVLFAKLARTFAMDKYEIAYFLGKGLDVCVYDIRGAMDSIGYPSEAGVYHDIESVGSYLFDQKGYEPAKTLIYGSCGESFTAAHLFKKYHDQGINLFFQNAPKSLGSVISKINFIARWIFKLVSWVIQAPITSMCDKELEDFFNSEAKIKSLARRDNGYVVIAKTQGDTTASEKEIDEMAALFEEKGSEVALLASRPEDGMPNGETDPHLSHPIRNPKLQESILKTIF